MNKHQIVGLTWRDRDTGEVIDVYQKSEARGWVNYRRSDGTLGMVKREALLLHYERGQMSRESGAETEAQQDPGYIDPFLLDLPTADPADLPALTLDPLTIRCIRDREDPTSSHRTRRNAR